MKEKKEKDIKKIEAEKNEYLEGWKRAKADFINLKRRVDDDMQKVAKFANEELLLEILPVLDNFRRAFAHIPKEHKKSDWVLGIKQVERQLENITAQQGLEKIDVLGKEFSPENSEAIGFDKKDDYKDGTVCEVIEDGYKLRDKIIRPAKVKVCKKS